MALVMHFCVQKLHKFPHEFFDLPEDEQAMIIASIAVKVAADKKEAEEIERKKRSGRTRRRR